VLLLKIMGLMDILAGITLILYHYELIPLRFLLASLLYLLIKSIIFIGDLASAIELGISMYFIIIIFFPITIFTYIAAIYLFQKGLTSLIP
jgi:hypothetical protein